MPEENYLKEERLVHDFRGISPSLGGSTALSLRRGRDYLDLRRMAEAAHFILFKKQSDRDGLRTSYSSKDIPPVTYFLQ
jgi:hypothetical protein